MTTTLHIVIATAAAFLLGQCPSPVHSECNATYPNHNELSIDGNVEVVDNLYSLSDGLSVLTYNLVG